MCYDIVCHTVANTLHIIWTRVAVSLSIALCAAALSRLSAYLAIIATSLLFGGVSSSICVRYLGQLRN